MLSKLRSSVDEITVICRLRAAHLDSASVYIMMSVRGVNPGKFITDTGSNWIGKNEFRRQGEAYPPDHRHHWP